MAGSGWGVDAEREALLELVDSLAGKWPEPGGENRADHPADHPAEDSLSAAQRDLADRGLWAMGLPEACGGGDADPATTRAVIARVSGHRPALGLVMAQLHAAGAALATAHPELLAVAAEGGSIGVAEACGELGLAGVPRIDLGAAAGDLVLLTEQGCLLAPAATVTLGPAVRRTGLDGMSSGPAEIDTAGLERLDVDADQVRARLLAGQLAVAAGLADAASRHARRYAAERVQFGAPLDRLPTMRDRLAELAGHAAALIGLAVRADIPAADAPVLLRDALDRAIDAGRLAVQSLGGYGYLEEYPVARLFRDAVSLRAAAGVDPLAHRSVVAAR